MNRASMLVLAGLAPSTAFVAAGGGSGYAVLLATGDVQFAASCAVIGGWFAGLSIGLLLVEMSRNLGSINSDTTEPEEVVVDGYMRFANNAPVLITTTQDGNEGHRFDCTRQQWRVLAERVASGQYSLPINSLSVNGQPFEQRQIAQLRNDLIDARLAVKSSSGRVWLTERGRVFVGMQGQLPYRA